MANFSDIDMNNVQPSDDYSPIPVGEYVATITASEVKQTKDLTGKYIKLEVTVIEGQFKNRKIFCNLNMWNKNEQAVSIAKREMASIKIATGQLTATDTAIFHGKPVKVTLGIKPADGGYEASNTIKSWKSMTAPTTYVAPNPIGQPPAQSEKNHGKCHQYKI